MLANNKRDKYAHRHYVIFYGPMSCQSFVWSKPAYRPEGPERIPYNGTNVTNPLKQNSTCVLLAYPFSYTCLVDSPAPWGEHLDVYVRQPPPPPLDELADPLDRCTITSRDAAMFAQSPSPDPTQTDTTTLAKTGWGAYTSAPEICLLVLPTHA